MLGISGTHLCHCPDSWPWRLSDHCVRADRYVLLSSIAHEGLGVFHQLELQNVHEKTDGDVVVPHYQRDEFRCDIAGQITPAWSPRVFRSDHRDVSSPFGVYQEATSTSLNPPRYVGLISSTRCTGGLTA
jgi:hypothetical protein